VVVLQQEKRSEKKEVKQKDIAEMLSLGFDSFVSLDLADTKFDFL